MTDDELNALQEHGIISDNVVTEDEIASSDRETAIEWLEKNYETD